MKDHYITHFSPAVINSRIKRLNQLLRHLLQDEEVGDYDGMRDFLLPSSKSERTKSSAKSEDGPSSETSKRLGGDRGLPQRKASLVEAAINFLSPPKQDIRRHSPSEELDEWVITSGINKKGKFSLRVKSRSDSTSFSFLFYKMKKMIYLVLLITTLNVLYNNKGSITRDLFSIDGIVMKLLGT